MRHMKALAFCKACILCANEVLVCVRALVRSIDLNAIDLIIYYCLYVYFFSLRKLTNFITIIYLKLFVNYTHIH